MYFLGVLDDSQLIEMANVEPYRIIKYLISPFDSKFRLIENSGSSTFIYEIVNACMEPLKGFK